MQQITPLKEFDLSGVGTHDLRIRSIYYSQTFNALNLCALINRNVNGEVERRRAVATNKIH